MYDGDLSAHRVHVAVLDTAQCSCPKPGAHDERVDRFTISSSTAKEIGAALDDLGDVLDRPTHDRAAAGEEAREEVGEVDGRVDVDGLEGRAGRRARHEGV